MSSCVYGGGAYGGRTAVAQRESETARRRSGCRRPARSQGENRAAPEWCGRSSSRAALFFSLRVVPFSSARSTRERDRVAPLSFFFVVGFSSRRQTGEVTSSRRASRTARRSTADQPKPPRPRSPLSLSLAISSSRATTHHPSPLLGPPRDDPHLALARRLLLLIASTHTSCSRAAAASTNERTNEPKRPNGTTRGRARRRPRRPPSGRPRPVVASAPRVLSFCCAPARGLWWHPVDEVGRR